jgi:hypothetical protein
MINAINGISNTNNLKPAFKANEEAVTVTETVVHKEIISPSSDIMSSYHRGGLNFNQILNVRPLLPTIIHPKAVKSINGERIYTSDGRLHSIISEDNRVKTTYEIDPNDENVISTITTQSKETGKVILNQINTVEDGKYKEVGITAFEPRTGKESFFTNYVDGKVEYAGKIIRGHDGKETHVTKYYKDNSYSIHNESNPHYSSYMHISGDKKEIEYVENFESKNGEHEVFVKYYNGAPISIRESKTKTMPNLLMLDVIKDEDLVAVPPLAVKAAEKALLNSKGEETFYSNGALETKTVVHNDITTVLKFSPDNKLKNIESDFALVEIIDDNVYNYKEKISENETRETFRSDSMTRIRHEKNGKIKEISYDNKTKLPMSYREMELVDGEEKSKKTYCFDKNGMVNSAYNN